jgi:hypothetical protein
VLGKVPVWQRTPGGQLQHLVKLYSRGDLPHCPWLDGLTLKVRALEGGKGEFWGGEGGGGREGRGGGGGHTE